MLNLLLEEKEGEEGTVIKLIIRGPFLLYVLFIRIYSSNDKNFVTKFLFFILEFLIKPYLF